MKIDDRLTRFQRRLESALTQAELSDILEDKMQLFNIHRFRPNPKQCD